MCAFDHFSAQLFNVSIDNPYCRPPRLSNVFRVVFCDFGSVLLSIKYVRGEGMGEIGREGFMGWVEGRSGRGGRERGKEWDGGCERWEREKKTNKQFLRNDILRD